MYIIKTKNAEPFEADIVARASQFPVLHIHTHDITPINAYEIFEDEENAQTITSEEWMYNPYDGDEFVEGVIYYEYDHEKGFYPTEDTEKDPKKSYYALELFKTVVYEGYTEIYSVQKSHINEHPNEILIWLQRPSENIL